MYELYCWTLLQAAALLIGALLLHSHAIAKARAWPLPLPTMHARLQVTMDEGVCMV